MERTGTKILVWLALAFSLLSSLITALDMSFNAYALSLKSTFNFTQTQVEVSASMLTAGLAFAFLETIITGTLGYQGTFLISWILTSSSSGLLSLAAIYNKFIYTRPALLYTIQVIFAFSNLVAFIVVSKVIVETFPKKHSGKLVGMFYTANGFAPILYMLMMEKLFFYSLSDLFGTYSAMCVVILGITYLLLYRIIIDKKAGVTCQLMDSTYEDMERPLDDHQNEATSQTRDIVKTVFFHLIFWPSCVYYGCAYNCLNNLTSAADSSGSPDPSTNVYIPSVAIVASRLLFGFTFDRYHSYQCGFSLIFIAYASFATALSIVILVDDPVAINVAGVFAGVGIGPGLTIPLSVLILRFGQDCYSSVSVLSYALMAVVQITLQITTGLWYDAFITEADNDVTTCRGKDCFYWSFMIMLTLTIIAGIVHVINFVIVLYSQNWQTVKDASFMSFMESREEPKKPPRPGEQLATPTHKPAGF